MARLFHNNAQQPILILLAVMVVVVYCENQATRSEGSVSYHFPQESVPEPEECDAGDVSCFEAAEMNQQQQQHQTKQFLNHTEADKGLKQASKETDDRDNDDEEAETENDDEEDNDAPLLKWLTERAVPDVKTCGIYLAPSTIPGAGLGMFAGRTYKRSEIVTEGDIVIPLSEIDWHNGFNLPQFLWEEYTWSASSFTRMSEDNGYASGLQACSPGIGAAINCDLPLVNVVDTWTKIDTAGVHRKSHPGAGGFTPYNDRKSRATRRIQAGEELYIDYGESYFSTRRSTYGLMPLRKHYKEANELVKRYQKLRDRVFKNVKSEELKDEMQKDLWNVLLNWGFETRMMNALPEKYDEIDEIMEMGGTEWRNYRRSIRDLEWLDEHGQCMDNIKPGKSTIPNAGRGAFATRTIPAGGLVSPAPLIHIADKKELVMYDMLPENEDGLIHRNASSPYGYQLLLNYCFGHRNSTVLMSPYGLLSSLINHSPDKANTRIQWTTAPMRNPNWLNMQPHEFMHNSHSGLQFDFIAVRDIAANEEILINYGPEWEAAWQKHVSNWSIPEGAETYQSAYEMQKDYDADVPTEDEGGLGHHIQCYCLDHWRLINGLPESDDDYHRCRAIKRFQSTQQGDTRYMVELYYVEDDGWQQYEVITEVLFDVQRSIFHFEDTSFTRDHLMPFAFRHEMMIPDDVFPKAWMNKNKQ